MKRKIDLITAVLLTAAILISMFVCAYPTATAAESDDIAIGADYEADLAETGYAHRKISFEGIPDSFNSDIKSGVRHIFLSKSTAYLKINERFLLNVTDAYSHTINARAEFTSTDTAVAEVNATGFVTAKKNGIAKINVYDSVSGENLSCTVFVGEESAPTIAPTVAPTDEPTDPPEPTQPPTQKPTQAPTQKPTQAPTVAPQPTTPPDYLSLSASTATIYTGNYYHLKATSNAAVSFKSSNTSIATVNSSGIVTAVKAGTVTITASTATKSATCTITVKNGSSVNLSHKTCSVDRFMTIMLQSTTSGVTWSSSDTSVATVTNKKGYGLVYGVKAGTAVLTVKTSSGAATCLVTVESSYPVQFAYTTPNCAAKNQTVTLVCVTDTMRTGVRFEIDMGSDNRYVDATSMVQEGDTYVWKGTTSFSSAGTYDVKAYSQFDGGTAWYSCKDGETTAYVTNSNDMKTTVNARRRASDDLLKLLATFEGFSSSVYIDTFTDDDPTLGYGVLVYTGEKFYNNLTKTQAYAFLVQNVNNKNYASDVNNFLIKYNIKFNQQQFDALVSFAYNNGTGPFSNDNELIDALLDCKHNNERDFNYINKQYFIEKFCQYHHAGDKCVYGLLYRRVDETEMFFHGDYEANYGNYKYPIEFKCAYDSSFHT
ncbi:glycoside hydrolase family protein [uncultured Ruminococcus sp.]|uniref:glycoside hydrolase family protein n=1 Tax=uncultured Ruminococcus sp. TaxID=165186 RepID=UPI002930938A|nr:Ig-like domain-containing protein [uncultured Ruminococcus sp.]